MPGWKAAGWIAVIALVIVLANEMFGVTGRIRKALQKAG